MTSNGSVRRCTLFLFFVALAHESDRAAHGFQNTLVSNRGRCKPLHLPLPGPCKLTRSSRRFANSKDTAFNPSEEEERRAGILVLLTVPLAWGTFEPAVRFVYELKPSIPGFLFSLSYYAVAASSLILLALLSSPSSPQINNNSGENSILHNSQWPFQGGLELGMYLFIGNALQVLGLKTVPSDRAAFLLQLTTLFVPLLEAFIQRNPFAISMRTWTACAIALAGVALMSLDSPDNITLNDLQDIFHPIADGSSLALSSSLHLSSGDALIVAAALVYTFHCVRLEGYAKTSSAVELAASKATTETILNCFAVAALVWYSSQSSLSLHAVSSSDSSLASFVQEMGDDIVAFVAAITASDSSQPASVWVPALLAVLWTGWITCAYTIYAQSYGQRRVSAVTANLIYTIQPICTAILAWILLGETLGSAGYMGGALIASAVVLVATATSDTAVDKSKNDCEGNDSFSP